MVERQRERRNLTHHHLILDQPLAFIAALRTLLADWEHSTPKR